MAEETNAHQDGQNARDRRKIEKAAVLEIRVGRRDVEQAAVVEAGRGLATDGQQLTEKVSPSIHYIQDLPHRPGHQYGDMFTSDNSSVHNGDVLHYHSYSAHPPSNSFSGSYAHSTLRPVVNYVSRPGLENTLYEQLTVRSDASQNDMRTIVVWGLGGMGKSQLVLHFVSKHRHQYQAVFWVEAGQKEVIERDYVQIYKQLFPSAKGDSATVSLNDAVAGVKSWLQCQQGRTLWVMDSADEIEDDGSEHYIDLNHYLPEAPRLDRIITTRSSHIQDLSTSEGIAVDEMSKEEAMELFCRCAKVNYTGSDTRQELQKIIEELGCLALAVMLAGSYVGESPRLRSNLSFYLHDYRTHRKRLLSRKPRPAVHRYRDSVLSTWEMTFAAIQQQDPVAARLLTLLAFMNFDDIFPGLTQIRTLTESSGSPTARSWLKLLSFGGKLIDEYVIDASYQVLQSYSMVTWQSQREAYRMHKLVHTWGYDRLDENKQLEWSLAALQLLDEVICEYESELSMQLRLVPHVIANFTTICSAFSSTYRSTHQDRRSMRTIQKMLHRLGRWDDEHAVQAFIYQVTELALGSEHPDTITSMSRLASVISKQGRYKEAEELHRRTLELDRKISGPEHPDTLTSMVKLANILLEQSKNDEAAEMLRETLKLQEKVLGQEHPHTLVTIGYFAEVLSEQGEYEQAVKMQQQTLEVRQRILGGEHPDTLGSMNNLARALCKLGKFEEALEIFQKLCELDQKVLGPEHPYALTSMANFGSVYSDLGNHERAVEICRQTLELQQRTLGREHPHTLLTMIHLAGALSNQSKYEQALEIYQQTLELHRKVFGVEHPFTLTAMNSVASVLSKLRDHGQSVVMYRQLLELQQRVLGREHPETLTCMNNLAVELTKQEDYKTALCIHRKTLELRLKVLGQEHSLTQLSINNLFETLKIQAGCEQAAKPHDKRSNSSTR